MKRLTTIALALAALSVPGPPADAAAPTCQGVRATLVGKPNHVLEGTPHRDVVVTNGADYTRTYGGDDLVCVTGGLVYSEVDTRNGDDTVVVVSARGRVAMFAGTGDDTFRGGPEKDSVFTNDGGDDIRTGDGKDEVEPTMVHASSTIDLGPGRDEMLVTKDVVQGAGATVGAGDGHDILTVSLTTKLTVGLDNVAERLVVGGQDTGLHWSSFEEFRFGDTKAPLISFAGSDVAETIRLDHGLRRAHDYDFAMGGGNDAVRTFSNTDGHVDGGTGRDIFRSSPDVDNPTGFTADLVLGTATASYDGGAHHDWTLAGVEDLQARPVFLYGYPSVVMTGDDGPNRLIGKGCDVAIDGGAGDDRISAKGSDCDSTTRRSRATLTGGEGDDRLVGSFGRDVLDGGDGTDSADGGKRRDTCYAETTTRCELP